MRLAAFKAHGFKSFADPVSFKVHGELIGVVGPNGCGKSNIVDAVRWVLGESRASSLRGNTLADVMFNGSQQRKPADWCEVEVRFANDPQGKGGGMWAAYPEIIVRRELSRDGRQSYTINGANVRRRDVVDLFRGTGVAPRAYGVVEQGMVTEIAEASPEELRAFMEEAAGVSHYKERRRDSERRLEAGNENLGKLALVLDGLHKQAESLKRQARTARRHHELSEEITRLEALLILSRRAAAEKELSAHRRCLQEGDEKVKQLQAQLAKLKTQGDENKEARNSTQARLDDATARLGEAQQTVTAAEYDLQNVEQGKNVAHTRWQEAQQELDMLAEQARQQQVEEAQLQQQQAQVNKEVEENAGSAEVETGELARLQVERESAQTKMDSTRERLAEAVRQLEAKTMRRQMLEERLADIDKRLAAARATDEGLPLAEEISEELSGEEAPVASASDALAAAQQRHKQAVANVVTADDAMRQLENDGAKLTAEINTLSAMLQEEDWQAGGQRLAHVLQVDAGEWSQALDAALGRYAAALAVDDIAAFIADSRLPPSGTAVVDMHPAAVAAQPNSTGLLPLLENLQVPAERRQVLEYWLAGVYAAPDDSAAVAARARLAHNQIIVTRAGAVYGAHSLLMTGETRGGYNWEQRMRGLQETQQQQQDALAEKASVRQEAKTVAKDAEQEVEQLTRQLAEAQQVLSERRIELNRRIEQQRAAQQRREELGQQQQMLQQQQQQLVGEQTDLAAALAKQQQEHAACIAVFDQQKNELDNAGAALESYRERVHEAGLHRRDIQRRAEELARRLDEMAVRKRDNGERQQLMVQRVEGFKKEFKKYNESALQQTLADCRQRFAACEEEVAACRHRLQTVARAAEQSEAQLERSRTELEQRRQQVAEERLSENERALKVGYLNDALDELRLSPALLADIEMQGEASEVEKLQTAMEELRGKRERLGAINFMADSELREREVKISELERQKADVETAIAELKGTIRRIDDETQTRLQSMFEAVNREFSVLYKRLFGGGEARLEMVGDAILESGFELKVRPPGKRLFPVRMLSGGEKAASAAAFIFSILRLNPPPFCILDEVDAPLDDSRSQRFIELLQDISKTVQCLVVTHNKGTISSMPRLIGVTQEEPGTSKVVSVTLKDALQSAG